MLSQYSRASKQLGDFGEGLVTYALIRKEYEVAHVDHVGADLIAESEGSKMAISVKTRLFRSGSDESRIVVIDEDHLDKLKFFADRFDLDPVFAHVVSIADDHVIHLFMIRVIDIEPNLKKVKHGFSLRFSSKQIESTIAMPCIDYSCWPNELITHGLFTEAIDKQGSS